MIEGGGMVSEPVELVAVVGPPEDPPAESAEPSCDGGDVTDESAEAEKVAAVVPEKVRLADAIRTKNGFIAHISSLAEKALAAMPKREDPGAARERAAAEEAAAKEKEEKAKGKKKPKKGEPVEEELPPPDMNDLAALEAEAAQKALFAKLDDECHACASREDERFTFRVELIRRAAVRAASELWARAEQLWKHMDVCAEIRWVKTIFRNNA